MKEEAHQPDAVPPAVLADGFLFQFVPTEKTSRRQYK
jgi:hypothetical protein